MIYDIPKLSDPIQQGDIFVGLPRAELSLSEMVIIDEREEKLAEWVDIAKAGTAVKAIVPVRPVPAIVASQNCDALHSRDITLCEIREFRDVERGCKETRKPKSWVNIITQQARVNQKWFYLPPDSRLEFGERMGVDFLVTLRVARADLEALRLLRKGRLNNVAYEHFRERISEFFRRYPYDEWYPLSYEELLAYKETEEYSAVVPFPWQVPPAAKERP